MWIEEHIFLFTAHVRKSAFDFFFPRIASRNDTLWFICIFPSLPPRRSNIFRLITSKTCLSHNMMFHLDGGREKLFSIFNQTLSLERIKRVVNLISEIIKSFVLQK